MPRPLVPDTTIFVQYFRSGRNEDGLHQEIARGRLWLSTVVIAELYAGTRSREDARILDRFVAAFARIKRVVTPTSDDWVRAGQTLARQARLAGDLRPRDHLADVLILVSTARLSGSVLTANLRHFETWLELAKDSDMDVTVERPAWFG
jgi:predicted nucleic acid-binding protein